MNVCGILIVNKLHYSYKYKNKQVYAIENNDCLLLSLLPIYCSDIETYHYETTYMFST